MKKPVHWNDLPRFSPWPARLLGAAPFAERQRTSEAVLREYDRDKWGTVLQLLRQNPRFTSDDLLRQQGLDPEQECLFMSGSDFFSAPAREVMECYEALLLETLEQHRPKALVELGCGLGDKLLKVASRLKPNRVYGGELTAAGVACGERIASFLGMDATFGHFNYNDPATLAGVPADAVVYTSHSIEQIPHLPGLFIEALLERHPQCVIHLEPCYEDQDQDSTIGLMRRRYTELNDYNRNLVSLLTSFAERGALRITEHRANVFSDTPFNPTSVLVWKPA